MRPLNWVTNPIFAGTQALVLMIIPMGLPLLVPLQMFAPLPVLLTALWGGAQSAWIGAAIPVIGAFLLGDGLRFPLTVFLMFFGFPLLAAHMIRSGWKISQCLAAAFLLGVGALLLFFLWTLVVGIDFQADTALKLDAFKTNVLATIAKKGGDAVVLADARTMLEPILAMLALLLPGFVVSGWFMLHAVNLFSARFLVRKWGGEQLFAGEDLTEWRPPFQLVWVVIGSGVLAYGASGFSKLLGANLFLLLSILYFLQGMAIVQAGFRRYAVSGLLRTLFYLALFFWHQVVMFVTALGLFDIWVDFRERFFRTSNEGDDSPGS
ncbi:MAG: YybS family protein [Magnetococcus sp. YQC-9]